MGEPMWELKLYVAGKTPKSVTALKNLKKYCKEYLEGKYKIEVIDLLQKPQLAEGDQIFAVPTLVRKVPEPMRKIIGDLSNEEKVLVGLNIVPVKNNMKTKEMSSYYERASSEEAPTVALKLFVTGASPNSARAVANLKNICEKYLGKYDLEIIDVYQQPLKAKDEQIIALPMLLKFFPKPIKRLIGDMSDIQKVLRGLGLNL